MPAAGTAGQAGNIDRGCIIPVLIRKAFAHSLWGVPAGSDARTTNGPKGENSHAV
jgi:hypothetical protein